MRFPERPGAVSFTSGELGSLHGVTSVREGGDGEGVRGGRGRAGWNGQEGWPKLESGRGMDGECISDGMMGRGEEGLETL